MLTVSGLTKRYRAFVALNALSFSLPDGVITGLIGPNGSGKSTLLNCIAGFIPCDAGIFSMDGFDISERKSRVQFFSFMPERLELYPSYFVDEFLLFFERVTGSRDTKLCERLGLRQVLDKKIGELSKGYRQRLKLFVALAVRRKITLLDEPFDGFDPIQLSDIIGVITEEQKKGRTFLVSIHQLHDAEKLCENYMMLHEGRLIASGTKQCLTEHYRLSSSASMEDVFVEALQ